MSFTNQTNYTNFRLEVQGQRSNTFILNVQQAVIPSMRITSVESPSFRGIHRKQSPGSATEFDPLVVTFLVDEDLKAYLDVYRWMLDLNNYQTQQSGDLHKLLSNISFFVLDNNKVNIPVTFEFEEAWPMELGELSFNYTDEGLLAMTSTVTFMYNKMNIHTDEKVV